MERIYRFCLCFAALTLMALGVAMPTMAATSGTATPDPARTNVRVISDVPTDRPEIPAPTPLPTTDPRVGYQGAVGCDLFGPAEVEGYRVVCPGGTFLDFYISDGFIPGDHWELKGKNWDIFPNSAVTTSPGPVIQYGVPGRVYGYGTNPLDAYIECSYLHGVNIFPASGFILLVSDAPACAITVDPVRSRINRTP